MSISVISCSRTAADSDRIRAHMADLLKGEDHEFIGIVGEDNISRGYNVGFSRSRGENVILCHDDITIEPRKPSAKVYVVPEADVIGVAGASEIVGPGWVMAGTPHLHGRVAHQRPDGYGVCLYGPPCQDIKVLDGLYMCCKRKVLERVAFDESFQHHASDCDWSYRCHLAGFKLAVVNDMNVFHASAGDFGEAWQEAGRRFMHKHANTITPEPPREFGFAWRNVKTREEALEVMNG